MTGKSEHPENHPNYVDAAQILSCTTLLAREQKKGKKKEKKKRGRIAHFLNSLIWSGQTSLKGLSLSTLVLSSASILGPASPQRPA